MALSTTHLKLRCSYGLLMLEIIAISSLDTFIENSYEIDLNFIGLFENAVINTDSHNIFVGAVNSLYEFDSNLKVLTIFKTGPKPDDTLCPIQQPTCDLGKILTDSHSKAVLIDYENGYLIYCTTLFQGICYKRNLKNIRQKEEPIYKAIVANTVAASTFAFIAPGVIEDEDDKEVHHTNVLNIGVQNTPDSNRSDLVPSFASRRLDTFAIARENSSFVKTEKNLIDSDPQLFPIQYVYGFSSDGFSYTITVQKLSTNSEIYISKLFRVCQKDMYFYSYAELQLQCAYNESHYNLAQAAYLGKAGNQLAKALNIHDNEDVLYVLFSIGEPRQLEPTSDSALCIYSMNEVRRMFTYNIQECFNGKGMTGPDYFFGSADCKNLTQDWIVNDSYCGEYGEVNSPIDGIYPVEAKPATLFSETVTALTVGIVSEFTVAFVGTNNGHIIKVALETQTTGIVFEDLAVADGSKVKPSLFILPDQMHLFVLTERKLVKMKLYECSKYTTCGSCLDAYNPYCGWCSSKNKCSLRGECDSSDQELRWLAYRCTNISNVTTYDTQDKHTETILTPKLTRVFPLYGPRSGGTLLTLTGINFHVGINLSVSIGIVSCDIKSVNETTILASTEPDSQIPGGRKPAVIKNFVFLMIDGKMFYSSDRYEYKEDATVTRITPNSTIHSGGTNVTVLGTNLDTVQQPKIGVMLASTGQSAEDICQYNRADEGKKMTCLMPNILPLMTSLDQSQLMHVYVYFVMDGIERLRFLKKYYASLSSFIYFPNPKIHKFADANFLRIFDITEDYLEIKGEALTMGLNIKNYRVYIGSKPCNVTAVEEDFLHCVPEKPNTAGVYVSKQAVEVRIGSNLVFDIGYLKFNKPATVVTKDFRNSSINNGIIAVVILLAPIVMATIIVYIIMRKRMMGPSTERQAKHIRYVSTNGEDKILMELNRPNSYLSYGEGSPTIGCFATTIDDETRRSLKEKNIYIDCQYLQLGERIGAGNFGHVFKGYLRLPDMNEHTLVAVKTLHQNSPRHIDVEAFLNEALIMKYFNHQNVLNLTGICFGMDEMPLVVMPYMKHGDLLSYVRDEHNCPTIKDLIKFGICIAQGMAYLSELKFVHRDLACRNCMLDDNYQCKLADFGLSRDIYETEYYISERQKTTRLPVKWMALESLEKGKYSTKSDVWSYGIVLWELMTRGVNPYPEVDNWDIVRFLKQGRRLPQPMYCPDVLYAIMRKCWHPDPQKRPTFSQLASEISDMITLMKQAMKQGKHTASIQTTYVNIEHCTDYLFTDELMPTGLLTYDEGSSAPTSPTSTDSSQPLVFEQQSGKYFTL